VDGATRVADVVPAEDEIEATLRRYATAYEQLDVNGAQAVWPSVDTAALERAFGTLESQRVQFNQCEVTVNRPTALAVCRGTVTYVPRVGAREPTRQSVQWTFRLRHTGAAWVIEATQVKR
jgi:hypothetical protein